VGGLAGMNEKNHSVPGMKKRQYNKTENYQQSGVAHEHE
jgi:hypothetical protein